MKTEQLNYYLPAELIAQCPCSVRSDSRLLVLNRSSGDVTDSRFESIRDFLSSGDCLVLNDTKVLPARFFACRTTGGRLEGLYLGQNSENNWIAMIKGSRKLTIGEIIVLRDRSKNDYCEAKVLEKRPEGECLLRLKTEKDTEAVLDAIGFPPLPPYIKRNDDPKQAQTDKLRYQTVYARHTGAVAAPTAGLHFTEPLIEQLKQAGINFAYITLHVGAATFKPVTAENLDDHRIHREKFSIDKENARIINAAKSQGGRIIPVGTTSTRTIESTATAGPEIEAASGTTDLFIKPGYKFRITDAMITNFHLPKSTLLALVAAFAGLDNILAAYNHAIEKRYRFYSYGDAMLII
ncbi:MAG: tRNA preQ1(34) S-adenosylmethionine ribosyltransferase-isomerase QueA [Sedimentisphaerales bacterium]|nr:tRNA preQ1(34) S-adenosylmethionine ribosyltransferase-isomerase QueA [Sedimentisphaerales bacterium]